ncbi:MAG: efflux RND transporter periplasmic adaptor subunit [Calditrichaceae bacterium]|nr:efflux RND transporter periplasmic adaptor subunit [Calditrichaceae bacterium]MBN2708629.1 efflux RND transporter periplasmic adaptor subunit [Calditrichaceae bacterium]RQV95479.1 MAG: efflux RND transporter periplasmic adaptor subunit [Calditrichota bacterium]
MKTNIKAVIIIALSTLFAGMVIGGLLFGGPTIEHIDKPDHKVITAGETIWICSMHPQIRQNEPGDCPICGMDLIPLENETDVINPLALRMSPAAMQLADIQTMTVQKAQPVKAIYFNGKIEIDERLLFTQSSHIPGRIEALSVNFTGDYMEKGRVIATVYSPELVMAQEELFEARKIKDVQPQLFIAAKEKLKNWKLGEGQINAILSSGQTQEAFPIIADVSGYVTKKMVSPGDYITKGKGLYRMADLSSIWLLLDVYESDLPWIKKGDKVNFTVSALPGDNFSGVIDYIDPVIDPETRVAKARVEAVNKGFKLKPGMFASAVVKARFIGQSKQIIVPKTAVMWTGKRSLVYVKNASETGVSFIHRNVTLGPDLGEAYIVESGLREGEEIAVNGVFSIDAAAQLAGKPSMINRPENDDTVQADHKKMKNESSIQAENEHEHEKTVKKDPSAEMEHVQFRVDGNCGMCKERIEKAALSVAGVQKAEWQAETQMIHIMYDKNKTTLDDVHKVIALAGHDTEKQRAPDEVYNNLPQCCLYRK